MAKVWMRKIRVTLTSKITDSNGKGLEIVFGDENIGADYKDQLAMTISGTMYPSLLKDSGTITITNMDYDTIAKIVLYQCYKIKIEAGYMGGSFLTYFQGEVSFISQEIHSRHNCTCYITYASSLVASFSQSRINFSLRSGINVYALYKHIFLSAGIPTNGLSQYLKGVVYNELAVESGTVVSVINSITEGLKDTLNISTANQDSEIISLLYTKDRKVWDINPNYIPIGKGNPTLSSDGVDITLLPLRNYKVGDIIKIDNGLLTYAIKNAEQVTSDFSANYISTNGEYMIYQIDYNFQNRGEKFELNIKARSVSLLGGLAEGVTTS